jgi:cytochrome P450
MPKYDPYSHSLHEDPYPTYAELRGRCPVYHDEHEDFWALFRFADVKSASRDWQSFTSTSGSFLEEELEAMREFMPPEGKFQDLDPPRCAELRRVVRDPFLPRAVAAREDDIRAIVVELIEGFAERGSADLAVELAEPLPVRVISDMLGIAQAEHARVSQWCHLMFERVDGVATERAYEAGYAIRDHIAAMAEERRASPLDDLMSDIANATIDGVPLTAREVLGMAMLLYAAGNETTAMLIGNALWLLDRHPDVRERLRTTPEAIPGAIEEILRFEAPVSYQARMTTRDVEIGGATIPAGKKVLLVYGAGNRDEAAFASANPLRSRTARGTEPGLRRGTAFLPWCTACTARSASRARGGPGADPRLPGGRAGCLESGLGAARPGQSSRRPGAGGLGHSVRELVESYFAAERRRDVSLQGLFVLGNRCSAIRHNTTRPSPGI